MPKRSEISPLLSAAELGILHGSGNFIGQSLTFLAFMRLQQGTQKQLAQENRSPDPAAACTAQTSPAVMWFPEFLGGSGGDIRRSKIKPKGVLS